MIVRGDCLAGQAVFLFSLRMLLKWSSYVVSAPRTIFKKWSAVRTLTMADGKVFIQTSPPTGGQND